MIIERRGTRALKAYFAVGVLCHLKNVMDAILVSCKPMGSLSQT